MDDILNEHITNIIASSQALLSEADGELNDKQRRGIKTILGNAENFIHIATEFLAVPIDEITADLRHELGNPLTPIRGYSELLVMGMMGTINEQQEQHMKLIFQSTETLGGLVEKLVEQARNSANR